MTLFSALAVLAAQFALILAEETAGEATGSGMSSSIWIIIIVLFVVLVGVVWAITNRIQPPSDH
ncbi:MAG: hypothetical protein U0175_33985 [Caldilineaceae bacterium]